MANGRQKGVAEEQISFDSLTEKQKQRLRNAGLLEEDTMENTELVVQILRANEGMDVEALRTFQLFRMVDKMTLTRIANQLKPVDFKAGEMVLRAGQVGDSMYFINSGRVAAVVQGQQLPPMKRGQFFGEIAIVSHCAHHVGEAEMSQGCVRTADVVCLENCDLLELKKDTVLSIMHSAPRLYAALQDMARERLSHDKGGSSSTSPHTGGKPYDPKERDDFNHGVDGGYDYFPEESLDHPGSPVGVGSRALSPVNSSRDGRTQSPMGRSRENKGVALLQKRELMRKEQSKLLPPGSLPSGRVFQVCACACSCMCACACACACACVCAWAWA